MTEVLTYLLTTFGLAGVFVVSLIYLLVIEPEKGEIVAGWLAKLVAWTGKRAEKTATALSIQGKIDSFAKAVETEVRGLLPYGLKIKWISPEMSREAFINEGKVVILLSHHHNQDENLSRATSLYMSKAVIPEARPHIDAKLSKAIDLMMTKKALYNFVEARSSFDHFISNVLRPETEKDAALKEYCESIDATDERGLFTRILLRELLELGRRRAGATETGDSVFEANEFVKHLKKIAEKEKGKDVDPNFLRKNIRMSVILVARPEKLGQGQQPYINAIEKYGMKNGARTIYVFSRGDRNIEFTKQVVGSCEQQFGSLAKLHEEEYPTILETGKSIPGYCAIFFNRKGT